MKVLIAPDKFKGTLSAEEVCSVISETLLSINPSLEITTIPLADGGEGTFEILLSHFNGRKKTLTVSDPLFRPIQSVYGISKDGTIAIIEMARASGLQLLKDSEQNPLVTTTFGTGQLIADALDEGVEHIIIGIGGSATNDAGIGMATALGYRFLNNMGEEIQSIGKNLIEITSIDSKNVHPRISSTKFTVLCDVENPLFGEYGAAYIYAPQKGALPADVKLLDEGLKHFSETAGKLLGINLNFEGAGAAGGMGAGAKLFLHASFRKGIEFISDITKLEEKIKTSDLIITGEGRLDDQSVSGKVVGYLIVLAKQHDKPIIIICGQNTIRQSIPYMVKQVITLAKDKSEIERAMTDTTNVLKEKIKKELLL